MGAMDHFGSAVTALHPLRCIQGKMCHLACCIDPSRHKRPGCSITSSITTVCIIGQSLLKVVPAHPSSDILMNRLTGDVWVSEKACNPDLKQKTATHMNTCLPMCMEAEMVQPFREISWPRQGEWIRSLAPVIGETHLLPPELWSQVITWEFGGSLVYTAWIRIARAT